MPKGISAKTGKPNTDIVNNRRPTPSQMSVTLNHATKGLMLGPVERKPEAIRQRMAEYFQNCEADGILPTTVGMANYFGIAKRTLEYWKSGSHCTKEITDVVRLGFQIVEEVWANSASQGQVFAPFAMFMLKCAHNYNDQPKPEEEPKETVISETSMEEVLQLAESNVKDATILEIINEDE